MKNLPAVQESACNARDSGLIPGSGRPWRRKWQPSPVFLPRKSCGERSLSGLQSRCGQAGFLSGGSRELPQAGFSSFYSLPTSWTHVLLPPLKTVTASDVFSFHHLWFLFSLLSPRAHGIIWDKPPPSTSSQDLFFFSSKDL